MTSAWLVVLVGLAAGFVSSIPPAGPVAVLVLRNAWKGRYAQGMAVATGAAFGEAMYCLLASFGVSWLFTRHPDIARVMQWVGVAMMVGIGVFMIARPLEPAVDEGDAQAQDLDKTPGQWPKNLLVGLTIAGLNPTLMVTWTAGIATAVSLGGLHLGFADKIAFPVGVGLGIATWFAVLVSLVRRFGERIPVRVMRSVLLAAGAALIGLGLWYAYKLVVGQ